MRVRLVLLALALSAMTLWGTPSAVRAARHHFYVGTITAISDSALTIHSKTHGADFRFAIDGNTRFLQHGQQIPRSRFHVGSYVTVSFSPGPRNTLIAYHISLRR